MISIFMYGKRECVLFWVWCSVLGVMVCTKKIPYMSFFCCIYGMSARVCKRCIIGCFGILLF